MVMNLTEMTSYQGGREVRLTQNDWEPTLRKRGFDQIVDHFLEAIRSGQSHQPETPDFLTTHRVCEQIVKELED